MKSALSVSQKDSMDGYTSCVKPSTQLRCYTSVYFRPVIHMSKLKEIKEKKKRKTTLADGQPL